MNRCCRNTTGLGVAVVLALAGCGLEDDGPGTRAVPVAAAPKADPALAISPRFLEVKTSATRIEFSAPTRSGNREGGFRYVTGFATLSLNLDRLERLALEVALNSAWTDDPELTPLLLKADVLDVGRYPLASFTTRTIRPLEPEAPGKAGDTGATHRVEGELTLHGVKKALAFPVTVVVREGEATIAGELTLSESSFGVKLPGDGGGPVVVRFEVKAGRP